jgi:hypothetical protein
LVQGSATLLKELQLNRSEGVDGEQAARCLSTSLNGNKYLTHLVLEVQGLGQTVLPFDMDKLLCDVSSIDNISNSNHTLVGLFIMASQHTPSKLAQQCMLLNQKVDKAEVIRDKPRRLYFVGEFDVSQFSSMAVSMLPIVMSRTEGNAKQSAIYRLLQWFLELCNASGRT